MTREISSNYASHTALGRANPILQFLNRNAETVSLSATLFRQDVARNTVEEDFALLQTWTEPDDAFNNRAPVLSFYVGDGHVQIDCVLEALTGVTYDRPTLTGGVRKIVFNVNLKQYQEFSLESTKATDTRFHITKERDYYELVAQREYGDPLKGDIIRKRNPTKPNMQVADRIPFPAIAGIRLERVTQTSLALATAYGKRTSPQKTNRLGIFDRRNLPFVSHIVIE